MADIEQGAPNTYQTKVQGPRSKVAVLRECRLLDVVDVAEIVNLLEGI